jgi:hypothetical protein
MGRQFFAVVLCATATATLVSNDCRGQIGYGVNSASQLFYFDVTAPGPIPVTNVGAPLSFLPEGIDFRPGSRTLYAIDIGANTSQLYSIDISTAVATPIGDGFTSTGTVSAIPYNLTTSTAFGFDVNPKTLQPDGETLFIRLVNTANENLRLNSTTGEIQAVDTDLTIGGDAPFVDAVAYINNNVAEAPPAGTTLFDMDTRNNSLYTQTPANAGTLTLVGPFGAGIGNSQTRAHFDVYTDPDDADPLIGGDTGYAVYKRPDAPVGPNAGSYLLYNVNLLTGATTNGKLVGDPTIMNFDGGFSVLPIPEPTSMMLFALGSTLCALGLRRRDV